MAAPGSVSAAPPEMVLHSFSGYPNDGSAPLAGLIADSAGNLYGTTNVGGSSFCFGGGCGTVFELSPPTTTDGTWIQKVLYSFTGGNDGGYPQAGLIADSAGNLYGTTYVGGASNNGTVFELTGTGFAVFAGTPGMSNCHGQSVSA
jgi:uncharacterized repeat protein (TIGR03803 family)